MVLPITKLCLACKAMFHELLNSSYLAFNNVADIFVVAFYVMNGMGRVLDPVLISALISQD